MKSKRTMTDEAIAASQNNGKKNKGRDDSSHVSQHARKHGLTSKRLVFDTEEERQEFEALLDDLTDEYQPVGRTAIELVDKAAVAFWNGAKESGLEVQELAQRRKGAAAILTTLAANYDGEQLPLFTGPDGSQSAAQFGWDCQELVVRTGTSKSQEESVGIREDRREKIGHVQIEAKLNTSLDTLLRYHATINKDLYRALEELRTVQRERGSEALPRSTQHQSMLVDRRQGGN
jgi:selenocysteine-specific translation elongation factor